ncbi:hypothetical protein QMM42_08290 [Leptospira santarosai]|uniref:hypothetical protein n=1 Tax=Leptospira santarosai TaxID=28183 RepID=UPI0024AED5A0|nr:hypothetical protein [Leptospira santarosai]MDI7186203.1 hypothetical protein [Leptospira santarosai]
MEEKPENIWKSMEDDYFVMQDILCRLSIEVILFTLKSESFIALSKQQPYYLMFAYYHDEKASVIFDSSNTMEIELYLELKKNNSDSDFKNSATYSNTEWSYDEEKKKLTLPNIQREFETVPLNFVHYPLTRELALEHHLLKELPEEMIFMKSLKELRIQKNKVTHLPDFLQNMPSLKLIEAGENPIPNENKGKLVQNLKQKNSKLQINFKKAETNF